MQSVFSLNLYNPFLHIHHFVFLIFSACAFKLHRQNLCSDPSNESFLLWMLIGNLAIFGLILFFSIMLKTGILDYISEKLCNAVCLTLLTLLFIGGILIYNIISMGYSLIMYFSYESSICKDLQLFITFSAHIFIIIDAILLASLCYYCLRKKDQDNDSTYVGMK